jgi:GrpB-like predicted nucleotidyltransferase (UPF0157 family)
MIAHIERIWCPTLTSDQLVGGAPLRSEAIMQNMNEQPVEIVDYDPAWPEAWVRERHLLESLIGDFIVGGCEHIGSTAVPGLPAKPVVDVMVGVASLEASRPAIDVLSRSGYLYSPYRPDVMHWFCKPSLALRTHHVHLVPFGCELWQDRLLFRDHLRMHGSIAGEYARLKRELAARHRNDREAYTDGKTAFVQRILAIAHANEQAQAAGRTDRTRDSQAMR